MKLDQAQIDNAKAILDYTDHHRADRRPHRHPPGRRGQHRARLRRDRHRRSSRSFSRSRSCSRCRSSSSPTSTALSPRARASPVEAFGADNKTVIDQRHAAGGRQPGRPDHRHDQAQGRIPQRRAQLWPGQFVNVRLLVDTLQAGRGGADRGGAARAERHVRLRGAAGQHGRGAAGHDVAAGRDAGRHRQRPAAGRARRDHRLRPSHGRRQGHGDQRRADASLPTPASAVAAAAAS